MIDHSSKCYKLFVHQLRVRDTRICAVLLQIANNTTSHGTHMRVFLVLFPRITLDILALEVQKNMSQRRVQGYMPSTSEGTKRTRAYQSMACVLLVLFWHHQLFLVQVACSTSEAHMVIWHHHEASCTRVLPLPWRLSGSTRSACQRTPRGEHVSVVFTHVLALRTRLGHTQ